MTDFLFAAAPIAFLVVAMTKPRPVPSTVAFFLGAILAYGIGLLYFGSSAMLLNAAVINGLLEALTPISIVFGAILFFVALEKSGAMRVLQEWLRGISPNPVAQIMIVGWAFLFLIEGACGFGTPAALAAPILVGLGFAPMQVAVLCVVFNTIPTAMGAVGTPLWFGFEPLGMPPEMMLQIGLKSAFLQGAAALLVPVLALRFVVSWSTIRANILFIYLSILSCTVPMVAVASFNYEFPTVVGGVIGLLATILLARSGIGLQPAASPDAPRGRLLTPPVLLALFPLGATVAILLLTRIPALGLRGMLTAQDPALTLDLSPIGTLAVSPALVVRLSDILGQGPNWTHAFLYVPSLIPFFLTAGLALVIYRCGPATGLACLRETAARVATPVVALLGALVFVKILMTGADRAPTFLLGNALAEAAGGAWIYFAPFLGALGSFFSGSTTISNLTFGGIQASIAADTALPSTTLLALQNSGAAMGNMICIHNIVAVCAVLALKNVEGKILKEAFPLVLAYGAVLAVMAWLFG